LQLVFLPPYSPKLNLIEGLWGWLKSEVVNNVFYACANQIRKAAQGFIDSVNKVPLQVIDRLCLRL
ncbi:MAG: transposase, partial [Clostridia bacterium]